VEKTSVPLRVHGIIPSYVSGTLIRSGPGSLTIENTAKGSYNVSHWFDGFGITHRFEISATRDKADVLYSSKCQVDTLLEDIKRTGDMRSFTFAQKRDPCIGFFGKVMSSFQNMIQLGSPEPKVMNVAVNFMTNMPGLPSAAARTRKGHDSGLNNLYIQTDTSFLKELDPETLEPIGIAQQSALHPELTGPLSCAHSKVDPVSGDVFNYNLSFGRYASYRVFKVNASTGETEILATITGPGVQPAYLHSFFLTEDYVILAVWSSWIAGYGAKVVWEMNVLDAIQPFDETKKVKWFVIDRRNGKGLVGEFESDARFSFHSVNAWQVSREDGTVDAMCEVVEYKNLDVLHKFYYENLRSSGTGAVNFMREKGQACFPRLVRYKLTNIGKETLDRNKMSGDGLPQAESVLEIDSPGAGELPNINRKFATKENRFAYTIVNRGLSTFLDGLSKIDTLTKECIYWANPKGHTPGEAIFIADPTGVEEDDGVLLSVVLDGFEGKSYLLCLDAKTMEEMGRAECDWAIGLGFHGQHISSDGKSEGW
jgi:torulene dioxygenase